VCKPKNCPSFEQVAEYEGTKYDIIDDEYTSEIDEGYTVSQQLLSSSASAMITSTVGFIAVLMF
jgi:hypothetical protein